MSAFLNLLTVLADFIAGSIVVIVLILEVLETLVAPALLLLLRCTEAMLLCNIDGGVAAWK